MEITLNMAQWQYLKKIISQGKRSESTLSRPVEVSNANVSIEIDVDKVKITLPD